MQLSGSERWHDGLEALAKGMNYSMDRLAQECPRAVLAWVTDDEFTTWARNAADAMARCYGHFEFRKAGDEGAEWAARHSETRREVQ